MLSDSDSDSDYDGGGGGGGRSSSVGRCLASIGVDATRDLGACSSLTEEFTKIKRAYFRKILVVHPDKGGDAAEFREVNAAWELIRKLYEDRAVGSFADAAAAPAQDRYDFDYAGKASGSARGSGGRGGGSGGGGSGWASSAPRTHMPWQYYYDAAAQEVPPYKVELARSGRSKCNATRAARKCNPEDPLISKGEIRIGSLDAQAGTYSRWIHLECWRVPSRIWLGLAREEDGAGGADTGSLEECIAALSSMNEVQFTGFNDLSERDQREVASHAMKKANWARRQGRRAVTTTSRGAGAGSQSHAAAAAAAAAAAGAGASSAGGFSAGKGHSASGSGGGYEGDASGMAPTSGNAQSLVGRGGATSTALVAPPAARSRFYVIPRPGVNGAPRDFLKGKTVVMTGIFPEIGGGAGLNLGKDRLRSMCESFGARVTSAISGKTDMLIVGKEPGASKVSKASSSAKCQLVSLADLTLSIQGEQRLEAAAPPEIESFSAGYSGNSILNNLENGGARRLVEAARAPKPAGGEEGGRTARPGPKAARKKRAPAAAKKKRAPAAKAKPEPKAKKSAAAKKTATGAKKTATGAKKTAAGAKKTAAGAKRTAGGARNTAAGSKRKKREEGAAATRAPAKARKGKARATKKAEENALALAP
ncbi:unnamed protein product [Scytosiphon promiscuus]